MSTELYNIGDVIPLSFTRNLGSGPITGLTVSATVTNAKTGAVLLASTNLNETVSGNGIYTYLWTPTVTSKTECVITYNIGGTQSFTEYMTIDDTDLSSRTS
jgi:hypothetical protein